MVWIGASPTGSPFAGLKIVLDSAVDDARSTVPVAVLMLIVLLLVGWFAGAEGGGVRWRCGSASAEKAFAVMGLSAQMTGVTQHTQ
jgi:hypothetical protein